MNPHFDSEAELQQALTAWFTKLDLPFRRHPTIDGGSVPDFGLLFGDTPWGLIEVKKDLDYATFSVKDAADYFEQCLKYRITTDLPVFLGPFFVRHLSLSRFFHGGAQASAVASFSAIAGRLDVGLFFVQQDIDGDALSWSGLALTMRQQRVGQWNKWYRHSDVWPQEKIKMVGLNNAASKKVRK
jgi:hypothetical protein